MKFKGTLIVVKDCAEALRFYSDMFGLALVRDNDGNMELTENIHLQEARYWEKFTERNVISRSNSTELYFEEQDIEAFVEKLEMLYPETEYVNRLMTHSWGCGCPVDTSAEGRSTDRAGRRDQRVVRFYDPDGNLIEVGTPV